VKEGMIDSDGDGVIITTTDVPLGSGVGFSLGIGEITGVISGGLGTEGVGV
jgi:hypothetical protein